MTVAAALLVANSSAADLASYVTASIAPTGNTLLLAAIANEKASGTADTPTLSGNGITWTQIATVLITGATLRRLTLFRGSHATPSAGAVTADFAGATQTQGHWSVSEYTGVDLAQGDQGVLQFDTDTQNGTAIAAALAAFGSPTNAVVGHIGGAVSSATITAEGGYTVLSNTLNTPAIRQVVEFLASQDTTPAATLSAAANWAIIAVELAETVAGPAPTLTQVGGPAWRGMNRGLNRGA